MGNEKSQKYPQIARKPNDGEDQNSTKLRDEKLLLYASTCLHIFTVFYFLLSGDTIGKDGQEIDTIKNLEEHAKFRNPL